LFFPHIHILDYMQVRRDELFRQFEFKHILFLAGETRLFFHPLQSAKEDFTVTIGSQSFLKKHLKDFKDRSVF